MTTPRLVLNCLPSIVRNSRADDVVRQLELSASGPELAALAVAEELRGPDDAVEDDVVLAHEVVVPGVGALPPVAPGVGRAAIPRPLDRGGEVADDGVDPDVDPLVLLLLVAGHGNAHAPVEVARHRSRLAASLRSCEREVADVRAPVCLLLDPGRELLLERRQVEEEVRRLAEDRRLTVDLRAAARSDPPGRAGCRSCRTGRRARPGTRRSGTCPRCNGRAASGPWRRRTRPSSSARR